MAAPHSLRVNRYNRYPADYGHRADLLRVTGVCDHCEQLMEDAYQARLFAELPVADRIGTRWARARARVRRVASAAREPWALGAPF